MIRIDKIATSITVALLLFLVAVVPTHAASYTIDPWIFEDPVGVCPGIASMWDSSMGAPSPSLLLSKPCPTATMAAPGATIEGVDGWTLTELGFDVKTDEDCGAGAPRYNVYTSDTMYYFFGCAHGTATDLLNGWTNIMFTDSDAFPADGITPWPGFGTAVITGIDIVHDEEGTTHLDNINVNGQIAGGPSKQELMNSCKKGGWQDYTADPGPFKNQGQCVSHFARGDHGP
jgi:hypothetical protein